MATGRIGTTPVLTTRWSKAPAAGTTSLSGLDDNSVSLVYSVGYEAVYQNGVLLSRGNDYTATNGTTITLTTATVAGDIIEVFANQTIPLTDTYSQTVSDGRFIKNTLTTTTGDIIYASAANTPARLGIGSTDQVLKVSGGVPAWGAAPYPTFSGCEVYLTNDYTLATATQYTIAWTSENYDTDNYHSNSTNTTRLTVPAAGYYMINAGTVLSATGDTTTMKILKNGNDVKHNTEEGSASNYAFSEIHCVLSLAANDYIEVTVRHNKGSNATVFSGSFYTWANIARLG
jgi:hypothetical protein